jgi:hypothetical protein
MAIIYRAPPVVVFFFVFFGNVDPDVVELGVELVLRRSSAACVSALSTSVVTPAVVFEAWIAWPRLPVCVAVGG